MFSQSRAQKKADKFYQYEAYARAIPYYEKAIKSTPNDCKILSKLADCYRRIGQTFKAEAWYYKVVNCSQPDPKDYYFYAEVLKKNSKYAEAEEWLKKYARSSNVSPHTANQLNSAVYLEILKNNPKNATIFPLESNTDKTDFGGVWYKEDKIVFSSSGFLNAKTSGKFAYNNEPFLDMYIADIIKDSIKNIKPFSENLNTDFHEGPLCFTSDYKTVYFTRNNYVTKSEDNERVNRLKIMRAFFSEGKWVKEESLSFNSDNYSCGHPALSEDGTKLYFVSDMPGGKGGTDIYVSNIFNGNFGTPENLGDLINTSGNEMFPFIHPSGTLYFSSEGLRGLGGLDIFYSDSEDGKFIEPENMGYPINSPMDDFAFVIDRPKLKGYFSTNINSSKSDDIYRFKLVPKPPQATRDSLETYKNVPELEITPLENDKIGDCKVFILSEFSTTSIKGGQILRKGNNMLSYIPPKDFFGVDSFAYTICDTFTIAKGCSQAYIVVNLLNRVYTAKITVVDKLTSATLDSAKVIVTNKNTGKEQTYFTQKDGTLNLGLDESTDYDLAYSMLDYYDAKGNLTTKNVQQNEQVIVQPMNAYPYILDGVVVYKATRQPVKGISATLFGESKTAIAKTKSDTTGHIHFPLEANKNYFVRFTKEGFINRTVKFTTGKATPRVIQISDTIDLDSLKIGVKFRISIFFDLGKSNIRKDAKKILASAVVTFLKENPTVIIELSSHTDSRGSAESNEKLSQSRAESSVQYLISQGIEPTRMKAKGYGESRLVNGCADGVKCKEIQHQENRRTEIEILGY